MNKIVIFDMDGLLVNSEPAHFEAFRRTLGQNKAFSHRLTQEEYDKFVLGRTSRDGFEGILQSNNLIGDIDEFLEQKLQHFLDVFDENVKPYPDAVALVNQLIGKTRLALVSGSQRPEVDRAIKLLRLDGVFEVIISGDDVKNGKPSPEPYLLATETMGVNPKDCVVVEDTPAGVRSGNTAGMATIAVTHTNKAEALGEAGLVVDSLEDGKVMEFVSK